MAGFSTAALLAGLVGGSLFVGGRRGGDKRSDAAAERTGGQRPATIGGNAKDPAARDTTGGGTGTRPPNLKNPEERRQAADARRGRVGRPGGNKVKAPDSLATMSDANRAALAAALRARRRGQGASLIGGTPPGGGPRAILQPRTLIGG